MAKIGQWQIFQLSIFILSREKCQHQSHWMRNFRVFLFVYWFFHLLEKFEPHCLSAIRIFQCFSRHNPRKVRQTTLYWESWRLCPSFIKKSDVSGANWLYQHTWKNTIFFHACFYGFSQGRKSLYNTAVYLINIIITWHVRFLCVLYRVPDLNAIPLNIITCACYERAK